MKPRVVLLASAGLVVAARVAPPGFPAPSGEGWSVVLDAEGHASVKAGQPPAVADAVAWGTFNDAINSTGWSVLDVHSSPAQSGERQSYAAGFLEGLLTHERIAQHRVNMWGNDFPDAKVPHSISSWMDNNVQWMREQVVQRKSDPYWALAGFLLDQLHGLSDGYNEARRRLGKPPVPEAQVLLQTLVDTDMDDVVTAVEKHGHLVNEHYRHHSRRRRSAAAGVPGRKGHCSALVQCAPGNTDLWVGHATWDEYRGMLRMVKYFDMPLPGAVARRLVFTSNPGVLYSGDDFYITDAGLTVLETSIQNYNQSLWSRVQPQSMLTWARAMVASRLATTGEEWTDIQLRHQSGTCNNQWMVVDYKRFTPGQPLKDGTLWICEAVPGHSRRADVTSALLEQGSWPSYNIPFFRDIWEAGGYGAMEAQHPRHADTYSFTRDPRARMFARARNEGLVTNMSSFMELMRYNRRDDPLACGDACNGISARCDLNPHDNASYDCFGAIDAKVTSYRSAVSDLSFYAISSPAFGHGERPFAWRDQDPQVDGCAPEQHRGHPDIFNFTWYAMPSRVGPGIGSEPMPGALFAGVCGMVLCLVAGLVAARRLRGGGLSLEPTSDEGSGYARL